MPAPRRQHHGKPSQTREQNHAAALYWAGTAPIERVTDDWWVEHTVNSKAPRGTADHAVLMGKVRAAVVVRLAREQGA